RVREPRRRDAAAAAAQGQRRRLLCCRNPKVPVPAVQRPRSGVAVRLCVQHRSPPLASVFLV
ncbi:hypothetical protein LPJ70_001941, partial [Coemansia sp. RSA 2708]